jgi:uncharacterized protein
MKILIDIGHPGHVHLFKNFAFEMQKNGHILFFTCREKEFEIALLRSFGFNFKSFGQKYYSTSGKIWGLIKFDIKEFIAALQFKPDVFLSHGSMYAAHAAFLTGKPHIALEDTGNMEQVRLYKPFTKAILVPEMFHKELGSKQIRYKGIHELFYLHPKYFTPDKSIYKDLKLQESDEYVVLRLISWSATHDVESENKSKLSSIFSVVEKMKAMNLHVFISSEGQMPSQLAKYQIKIKPERLHHALAYAKLYVGEGTTTATEASLLGTPSIVINQQAKHLGIQQNLNRIYELQYYFDNIEEANNKIFELLQTNDLKNIWQQRRDRFLSENINPTEFLVDFISNKKWSKTNE